MGWRAEELVLSSFVVVFSPVLPTKFIPGRVRQPIDDARTASITLGSRLKSTARGKYLPPEASWQMYSGAELIYPAYSVQR